MTRSPADHAIPSPPGLPWVGNLLHIPKARVTQYLLELSRGFDGILALDFAGARLPFVFDPDLVAELSDPRRFGKAIGPPLSTLRRLAGDGLFTARGDEPNWGKAHRILMPAFGQRAMKGYFPLMREVAGQLLAKWERLGPHADIEVADDMTRLTLDTISLAGFGHRFDSFARQALHPFLIALADTLGEVMNRLTRLPIQNRLMPGSLERIDRDIATMHALVDDVIRARREGRADSASGDLLDLMLQARDPVTGEALDNENIRNQVITFLIAGHETTSGLLTFALYLLMRHPQVLAQCYAEVDRVMPAGVEPAYEQLGRLDVIDRVLRETLRLWPTAPSYAVAPFEDTTLGGRYPIRRGQRVMVFLPALHRHPRHWEDPESFDIERFTPTGRARIHPHAYKPFGNGERACIGQQFALTEAKLALAMILRRFALSDPHDYRFAIKETLTLKPDGFRLRARPRTDLAALAGASRPAALPAAEAGAAAAVAEPRRASASSPSVVPAAEAGSRPARGGSAGSPVRVYHGSSVGTCQAIAEQVAECARRWGHVAQVADLDTLLDEPPTSGWLVVVCATYNGRAPDNARRLEARLDAGDLPAWRAPALRYALLGVGNSQWPAYQAFPKRVAGWLAGIGATEALARAQADGNADADRSIDDWLEQLDAELGRGVPLQAARAPSVALDVSISDADDIRRAWLPPGTVALTVLENRELVGPPEGLWDFAQEPPRPSTRHLRLALPHGVSYRTGDHLSVYAHNDPAKVDALLVRLGLDPQALVTVRGSGALARHLPEGRPIRARQLFGELVELQDPAHRRDIERLHAATRCPHTRAELSAWLGESPNDEAARARLHAQVTVPRRSVADLLLQFPAIEWTLADFLLGCTPMRPRWYSVSSSPLRDPASLTLTVGSLDAPAIGREGRHRGVASNHLCALRAGDVVHGQLRTPQPDFAPPEEAAMPIVMIGPGTGIAPFRGFLEDRAARRDAGATLGGAWLFTGARHPAHDDLYGEQIRAWAREGLVEPVHAYSCLAAHPWRYVQDAVWAHGAQVWRCLDEGGRIYVCGDGKAMAPAVRDTLRRLHQARTGADEAQSARWLAGLIDAGRLRQDVFN